MIETTGTGTTSTTYNQSCANRLPCGVCRLMYTMCPLQQNWTVHPTWSWKTNYVELGTDTKMDEVE